MGCGTVGGWMGRGNKIWSVKNRKKNKILSSLLSPGFCQVYKNHTDSQGSKTERDLQQRVSQQLGRNWNRVKDGDCMDKVWLAEAMTHC